MRINIDEIPEDKDFDDYPADTEFTHRENFPRYDREALKENRIVRVYYGEPGYEKAATREELSSLNRP